MIAVIIIRVLIWCYQMLPDPAPVMRKRLVHLDWCRHRLPSLTTQHMQDPLVFGLVRPTFTNPYHAGLHRFLTFTSHHLRPDTRHTVHEPCVMLGYNGLELVVRGAVELGDAVLSSIGQHTGTGREVSTRLGRHTD